MFVRCCRNFVATATVCAALLSTVAGAHAGIFHPSHAIAYTVDRTGIYEADLYRPHEDAPAGGYPVVVLVHGGAWRSGSRTEMKKLALELTQHGYAALTIDYDKKKLSFPWSWMELRAAVRFLRLRAMFYHLDPNRIAVLGSSAGGELAALAALEPNGPAILPEGQMERDAVPVQAAVVLNGLYDAHTEHFLLRRYLGGHCAAVQEVCDDASPQSHITPNAVPIFVGHGDHDHMIPDVQAKKFMAAMQADGNNVTYYVARGGGHNYWKHSRYAQENLQAVLAFLDTNLKKK
ncbi:prolyl oligopeptidase family serine peptidase [Granulicella cerasi]|uniref:Prolyl oligopeptidase family serine peptidase n=1 Tax=Granulicella cerasi TaxID=741063 RepID=A0ABW1ZAS3_9BACT|nr:alpha/beta hydrolase [Granulicella cerasi]